MPLQEKHKDESIHFYNQTNLIHNTGSPLISAMNICPHHHINFPLMLIVDSAPDINKKK